MERVTFDLKPQSSRYVKMEFSGGSKEPLQIDKLEAWSITPLLVFDYKKGQSYQLFYGNPKAVAQGGGPGLQNVNKLLSSCPALGLGEELKPVAVKAPVNQPGAATVQRKQGWKGSRYRYASDRTSPSLQLHASGKVTSQRKARDAIEDVGPEIERVLRTIFRN